MVRGAPELEQLAPDWDALAVRTGAPYGAPAWALAWWRHVAPRGSRLAIVAVRDGDELVGLAPLYASRRLGVTELRLLGAGLASRLGVLCMPGAEPAVAAGIVAALAEQEPRCAAIRWEGVDAAARWPERLSAGWPGGGRRLLDEAERPGPVVDLRAHRSYEDWLGARSRHFRRRLARNRRAIEGRGGSFRLADGANLDRDLESFRRLHTARWRPRGGSLAVNAATMAMLRDAGRALVGVGRFRLLVIDGPDGEAVSAEVLLAAGGEVASWNGGFDESWGKLSPGLASICAAIEDAHSREDRRLDLGGGAAAYKDRLADHDRPVAWRTSYAPGSRYPLARLRRLPEQTARRASGRALEVLGPVHYNRVRRLFRI